MHSKVMTVSRILLGLIFLIFGSNGLMMVFTGQGFIPMPPPPPEVAEKMSGLFAVGYLLPLVKSLQVISALFLLSGKHVNLALVFLAPIIVNILAVHIFVDTAGFPMALFVLVLFAIVLKGRWSDFRPLFKR